ncbi:hypothetical protein [Rhizobium sp.]
MIRLVFAAAILLAPGAALAVDANCGYGPGDWCTSEKDGACGRHRTVDACRADPQCKGMEYRGESVVACQLDKDGYATNCPTVGCLDRN